jgi:hypothetical protein
MKTTEKPYYDINCENNLGKKTIVELQKEKKITSKTGLFTIKLFLFKNKLKRENGIIN